MVKVLDNDFGILMNASLKRLIVYKLDIPFSSNVDAENYSESTRDMLNYHISLHHKINCMGKKKKEGAVCVQ